MSLFQDKAVRLAAFLVFFTAATETLVVTADIYGGRQSLLTALNIPCKEIITVIGILEKLRIRLAQIIQRAVIITGKKA